MRILLSNDDGYQAPGLICLEKALSSFAHVTVVAPDRDRSGASGSLTIRNPVRATRAENGAIPMDGTPTDCVHLAITALMEEKPDIVVSGINSGPNLGDLVLYSGTVAAAREGRSLGFPAIAVSMTSKTPDHYETGARVVRSMIERMIHPDPAVVLPANTILNVNVPDVAWDELRGFQVTRLGVCPTLGVRREEKRDRDQNLRKFEANSELFNENLRRFWPIAAFPQQNRPKSDKLLGYEHRSTDTATTVDPWGDTLYWIVPAAEKNLDVAPGTDFSAIAQNKVSITPLHVDMTDQGALAHLSAWVRASGWM